MTPLVDSAWAWMKARPGLALALFAVLLYLPSVGYDYALDDLAVLTQNAHVKQGLAGIDDVLTSAYWEGFSTNAPAHYRPLSLVMFCVEVSLTGGAPWLPHLLNVLLYGLTALLAWHLLRPITSAATAAVAIWVAHPLHVEVVANVKSRDELMAFALGLGALLAARARRPVVVGVLVLLAMLSKESSITLLAVVPALLWWTTDQGPADLAKSTGAALAGALIWAFGRASALGTLRLEHPENMLHVTQNALLGTSSWSEHVGSLLAIGGRYVTMLVWPTFSFDYSIGQVPLVGPTNPLAMLGLLALAALVAVVVRGLRRRGSTAAFAAFATLATYSIASNAVVLVMGSTMGERYLYVPSFFVLVLVTLAWRGRLKLGLSLAAVALFAWRSADRLPDWRDNSTLIQADLENNPGNPRVVTHYAAVRTEDPLPWPVSVEKLDRAVALYESDPSRYHWSGAHAHHALGEVYRQGGRTEDARRHYQAAVDIESGHFPSWFNLGFTLYQLGDYTGSTEAYGAGLRYKAHHPLGNADATPWHDWWLNYCISARLDGRLELARNACLEATRLRPDWGMAWGALGQVEDSAGNTALAVELYTKARALDPTL